ncbi:hypothetical protein FEQ05_01757 [Burkholderia pseudomultivorans]|uniref:Uncharacterized protein n=1 Tax=Burkholderia pseudomultivorans TaxID=1207504 RepID=A0ABU2E3F6_9BURK|nr:hypothetical protein [Burkholderia pseudomultivorans]MDR8754365.1 hypothetical protein [Burkholderia pseudomultivorans]MDR8818054.1 hypothetical protein [Burkholderia pseudomultivorans]MDR8830478.1 hypothetical protein [Burkholderia pseudomultivorans]MDR8847567.1 hypothetical protein [Burkholderia pseudomultivorans]
MAQTPDLERAHRLRGSGGEWAKVFAGAYSAEPADFRGLEGLSPFRLFIWPTHLIPDPPAGAAVPCQNSVWSRKPVTIAFL